MTTGTQGNDTLTNDRFVTHEVIDALGGDDTITVLTPDIDWDENPTVTVHGGDGYDTLIMSDAVSGATTTNGVTTFYFYITSSQRYQVIYDGIEEMEVTGRLRSSSLVETGDAHDTLNLTVDIAGVANVSTGGGNDTVLLDGRADFIDISGGEGNDRLDISAVTIEFPHEPFELFGDAGNDTLIGHSGYATIMSGGTGDDNFTVNNLDHIVVELEGEGTDTATATVSGYTLADNVENLVLSGSVAIGYGNAIANVITGNSAANSLYGMAGDDTIDAGAGNDLLDGGAGADTMIGGTGHDSYYVDSRGDVVTEASGAGTDKVFSTFSYTLGANVENLQLLGSADIAGYGNELGNVVTGNSGVNYIKTFGGNDRLDGGAGADYLLGGDGDDTYFVDNAGDRVYESSATGGYDRVYSSVSFSLAYQQLERLHLTGTADINATGNSLDNVLEGNSGANVLDGGSGVDVMGGHGGDDTYIVDQTGDSAIEQAGGGTDTVLSYATFALSRAYELENLTLIGSSAINAYGNHLDNRLEGNDNNNILNGSAGADTMIGNGGTDFYFVDNAGDVAIETEGGGVDTVYASVSFSLEGQHLENLYLEGTADINATGNDLDNRLSGNSGNNVLDGGAGADIMNAGAGDDIYYVDNVGDRVLETSASGNDAIFTTVDFSLSKTGAETLRLIGSTSTTGTGDTAANLIVGNDVAHIMKGMGGDDVIDGRGSLYGGTGNDTLISRGDTDRFFFDTALDPVNNVDTIENFDTVGFDQFRLSTAVFTAIGAGVLSQDAFHEGSVAADAEDRIVYDVVNGNVFYDADGSGAGEAVLFAQVDPGVQLDYFHFFAY